MITSRSICVMQVLPELFTGGVERGTLDIARALVDAGHRSIVVSNGGPMVEQLEDCGARHITLPVHSKNPLSIRHNSTRLAALIRAFDVDIIHARSRAPAWSCYWACQQTNTPFITTFHGTYGHSNYLKRWYNRVMCRGDRTIAVSEFIADHIRKVYGEPEKPMQVIHRGIDMQLFDPETVEHEDIVRLKQQWQVPGDSKILLLPGRLTRWKGQLDFIEAVAKLRCDDSVGRHNVFGLIVGSNQGRTDYSQELERKIIALGISDRVKIIPHQDDMTLTYALADIIVSASREPEAFGRVACEAQAMQKLIVATQHGGAIETIAPEQQAWQCQPNDSDSLSHALNHALSIDESMLPQIHQASRRHIQASFSLESMTSQTLSIYEELAK